MAKKLDIAESVTPTTEVAHVGRPAKEVTEKRLQEFVREETKLVKGIFQCFECPGATVPIFVSKYKGVEPFKKSLTDGHEYEIPLYVARFLNGTDATAGALGDPNKRNVKIGTCSYGVHGFLYKAGQPMPGCTMDNKGIPVPIVGVSKRVKRYGFQSLEFGGLIE